MRFAAEVRDGKALWYDPRRVAEFIRTLEGQRVAIEIEPFKARHTDAQRRFYRGPVLNAIAEATGYSTEEAHEIFRFMFLKTEKDGREFARSTATLSKEDFSEYLDKVIRFAATELQCVIEDPQ